MSLLLKRILFTFLFLLLLLPAIQSSFPFVEETPLDGAYNLAPYPIFQYDSLLTGAYQPQLEHYLNDHLGFYPYIIRVRNQFAYSLFRVPHANQTVVGKDQVLYESRTIDEYLGQGFVGDEEVNRSVRRFKDVQDSLAKRGTFMMFALAPSKASVYPEYFPKTYRNSWKRRSNYEAYAARMREVGVNVLDLSSVFRQWKDTVQYPLFPRGGVHWSGYGVTLAADTLFRYIEQKGHTKLPKYSTHGGVITREMRSSDNDLALVLNLIWQPQPYPLFYPNIVFSPPQPATEKPNLLLVGDSFAMSLFNFYPYLQNEFSDKSRYWHYNNKVQWPDPAQTHDPIVDVSALDLKSQVESRNVILVLYTEYNLGGFDFGFSHNVYRLYHPLTAADSIKIKETEQAIRNSPEWLKTTQQQAAKQNRNLDELIHSNAVYMIENEK